MAQFRTFAEGEVLTAQDVNQYLVNETTTYNTADVAEIFSSLENGVSILYARASLTVNAAGAGTCVVTFAVAGLNVSAGSGNTTIGQLAPDFRPSIPFGFSGYYTNGSLQGASTGNGTVGVRWSDGASTNQKFFNTGSYPVGF